MDDFNKSNIEVSNENEVNQNNMSNLNNSDNSRYYKKPSWLLYLLTALIGAIIGGTITAAVAPAYFYGRIAPQNTVQNNSLGKSVVINTSEGITVASAVAKKVIPSIVGISTITIEKDIFGGGHPVEGVGSGVIVNPNGYILTNSHVVGRDRQQLTVFLKDGRELDGSVLWQDNILDLAVVKINAVNLPAAELGDSDTVQVGETAIAIGNPLGLRYERTVTQGIVSGLNRSIRVTEMDFMEDLIQTDAAINPGNSGGPLINSKGQIIGINTVKATTAEGLGFAIPINITKPIIGELAETGTFIPTYLGIGLLDREIAGYINTDIEIEKGIYITSVVPNTSAEQAGLRVGDIITHMDNIEVNTMIKFKALLYSRNPGEKTIVRLIREGKVYETEAVLQKRPEEYR